MVFSFFYMEFQHFIYLTPLVFAYQNESYEAVDFLYNIPHLDLNNIKFK